MHGQPDPDAVPYHIVHRTVASVTDKDSPDVVITGDGEVDRPYANDPEGLHLDWYEQDTGNSVECHLTLGAGYWDVESRDLCHLVAVERRGRQDKRREWMGDGDGPDGGFWAVLKYHKDTEGTGFQTVEMPGYDLPDRYGSGKFSRVCVDDFDALSIRGTRHDLKKHANHDDKTLDDFIWLRQRRFGDRSGLPP